MMQLTSLWLSDWQMATKMASEQWSDCHQRKGWRKAKVVIWAFFLGLKCYKAKPRKLGPNSKIFDYIKELEIIKTNRLLGHVCFSEFTFRETTFQTFLYLFAIKKVGQRKTLSGQRKTLSSQRKHFSVNGKHFPFWLCLFSGKWFPGNHFPNFPVFVCH